MRAAVSAITGDDAAGLLAAARARASDLLAAARARASDLLVWLVTLAALVGIKAYHASASVDELRWLLAPTASVVSAWTGAPFPYERGVGYVSLELSTAIVPACAGLNFFIMVFGMLATTFSPRLRRARSKATWFFAAAGLGYAVTIAVNAARIVGGITLRDAELAPWLSSSAVHRSEGVIVYLASLWLTFLMTDALFVRAGHRP